MARNNRSIEQLFAQEQARVVVVAQEQPVLYHAESPDTALFFHPGMALQRIRAMENGQVDRLIRVAGIKPGNHVIDATLGMGMDTMVIAHAVGESGRVTAMESSWWLVKLFEFAQGELNPKFPEVQSLLQRVQVIQGNHEQLLCAQAPCSAHVVVFDPMFRRPPDRESSMDTARHWTMAGALSERAVACAKRVAARSVVFKERPSSGEFERFGLLPDKPRARFAYGVWHQHGSRQMDG